MVSQDLGKEDDKWKRKVVKKDTDLQQALTNLNRLQEQLDGLSIYVVKTIMKKQLQIIEREK